MAIIARILSIRCIIRNDCLSCREVQALSHYFSEEKEKNVEMQGVAQKENSDVNEKEGARKMTALIKKQKTGA